MPMIPIPRAPMQNTNVPDPALQNPNQVGQVEQALSQAAGKVTDVGLGLMQKRKQAADNDYAFKTYVDDYQAIEGESNRLKLESPEDASGYAEGMKSFLAKRASENEANAPSQDGLRLYREKAGSLFKQSETEATNFENTTRAKYYVKNQAEAANKLASTFLANPDWQKAMVAQGTLVNEIDQNAQTHYVNAGQREQLKQQARDHVSMSVYDGLDAQENYSRQVQLLKNTDPATDLFSGMDAEKRGALLRRAENGLDTKRRQNDAELRGRVSDVMSAQMSGDQIDSGTAAKLIAEINASGLKPYEKAKYTDSLQISSVVANTKQELLNQNLNSWKAPDELIADRGDAKNARVVNQAQAVLSREMITLRKEAATDGANYALRSSPALREQSRMIQPGSADDTQNYAAQLLARQDALGVPRPRVLTSGQAQTVGQNFINQSPEDAAHSALALRQAYGKYAPKVFSEVAQAANLPADFQLVSYMPTEQSAATIVNNLKNEPAIKKAFLNTSHTSEAEFTRKVSAQLEPYVSAMNSNQTTGSLSLSNAITNQVRIEAMKQRVMPSGLSDGDAIGRAVDTVVKQNFATVKAGNSSFMMPKVDGQGKAVSDDAVAAFVRAHSRADGFAALNVAVDPEYTGDKTAFYNQMAKAAYWTPSKDNSELILATNVRGQARALVDNSGQPIRRSLHEISNNLDPLTIAEQTPMWKRLFKSNTAEAKPK